MNVFNVITSYICVITANQKCMGGHTGSGQYAHLKKNSQKRRAELQDEYKALSVEEQNTYKALAVIANTKLNEPTQKRLKMKTIFDKLHSIIDEAQDVYGVSCALITKHIDESDQPTLKTSFCNILYDAFNCQDSKGSLQGLNQTLLNGSLKFPPFNLEAAVKSYKLTNLNRNEIEQFHSLGHAKPAITSNREVKARYLGDYMRFLFNSIISQYFLTKTFTTMLSEPQSFSLPTDVHGSGLDYP